MTCAACGNDGQIEYGAYRGDAGTETRECRLCGGRPSGPLEKLYQAAMEAGVSMERMARTARTLTAASTTTAARIAHEHLLQPPTEPRSPSCYDYELERKSYRKGLGL